MNICIAGWYGKMSKPEGAFVVAHREMSGADAVIPNKGLEFGCYNWFLKNKWESGPTLFIHDDNEIDREALDTISGMTVDQAFLFGSDDEIKNNGGAHGRAILCSEKFLKQLKADGGFWYDEGQNGTPHTSDKPDYHNNAIQMFRAYAIWQQDMVTNRAIVVPGLRCGYRGEVK